MPVHRAVPGQAGQCTPPAKSSRASASAKASTSPNPHAPAAAHQARGRGGGRRAPPLGNRCGSRGHCSRPPPAAPARPSAPGAPAEQGKRGRGSVTFGWQGRRRAQAAAGALGAGPGAGRGGAAEGSVLAGRSAAAGSSHTPGQLARFASVGSASPTACPPPSMNLNVESTDTHICSRQAHLLELDGRCHHIRWRLGAQPLGH